MAGGVLCRAFARRVQDAVHWMSQIPVQGGHFVFADGILNGFEGGLFGGFGARGIGELEDVL